VTDTLAPIVKPARYAKGKMAVHCPGDGSGYKTRAMRLCAAVSSRWSNREKAYIMSAAAAKRVADAYAAETDVQLGDRNGVLDYVFEK
jgi:hypothetical protein